MNESRRIAIIDVGSNSIRLVIYEQNERGAYRIVDESKSSARLSEKTDESGQLRPEDAGSVVETLRRFKLLCEAHRVQRIRAVATAAIRNAVNRDELILYLREETGIELDVISGEEEARFGFLGAINTLDIHSGLLIDIGGGSTELTLFRERQLIHSVSFPFGAVNTTKRFTRQGETDPAALRAIREMVELALSKTPWIKENAGLPLVGLGGTVRTVCKLDQRDIGYPLPLTHGYEMDGDAITRMLARLAPMRVEQRKTVDGLDKARADLIVPGLIILQTVFRQSRSSQYIVSGAGLRDGLLTETIRPDAPILNNVLKHSVRNLLGLFPSVPIAHVEQVSRFALALLEAMPPIDAAPRARDYLQAAALLYRIGVTIHYHRYEKHTFYMMAHSRIDGLSHREMLICALVASHQTKSRTRRLYQEYKTVMSEADYVLAVKLGMLLRLAVALDRSETQPIRAITLLKHKTGFELRLDYRRFPQIELNELETLRKDFKTIWAVPLYLSLSDRPG